MVMLKEYKVRVISAAIQHPLLLRTLKRKKKGWRMNDKRCSLMVLSMLLKIIIC